MLNKKISNVSLFNCAKCGCIENTATSSYWLLRPKAAEECDWDESLVEYKGKPLCSACARVMYDGETGKDRVVPGKWHGKFEREFKKLNK